MARRLSYSMMLLAFSVPPAFAGDGGPQDGVGLLLVQAFGRLASKLFGLF
jgi:hypothetical protein